MTRLARFLLFLALAAVGPEALLSGAGPAALGSRAEAQGATTLYGDFNGDGLVPDRLDVYDNPFRWLVTLEGQSTATQWLSGWGQGVRNYVGDFDGDTRDDVLIYGQAWHLMLSTGTSFSPSVNVNPGFGLGYRECAVSYDNDPATELILESFYGSCWQYNSATSGFDWKACSRTCDFPRPLYYTENAELFEDGGAPLFIKGASYIGCRGVDPYTINFPSVPVEASSALEFYMTDCPQEKMRPDLAALKAKLGANTVRVLTPEPDAAAGAAPYYGDFFVRTGAHPGEITPNAQDALQGLFDLGQELDLKFTLALYVNYDDYPTSGPGTPRETFAFNYIDSLCNAFKDEPALFSYELTSEALLGNNNYWAPNGWEASVLSFHTRLARRLKACDGNHLITNGQVATLDRAPYNTAWHYPSPEFALLPDVDNLNGGLAFNLYSQLDYLSPHVYADAGIHSGTIAEMVSTTQALRTARDAQLVQKPLTLGEANYAYDGLEMAGHLGAPTANELEQANFFSQETAKLQQVDAKGLLVWDALPQLPLYPGSYTAVRDVPAYPSIITFELHTPQHPAERRIQTLGDRWNVFYPVRFCPTPGCDHLTDRPAAPVIRQYFALHP